MMSSSRSNNRGSRGARGQGARFEPNPFDRRPQRNTNGNSSNQTDASDNTSSSSRGQRGDRRDRGGRGNTGQRGGSNRGGYRGGSSFTGRRSTVFSSPSLSIANSTTHPQTEYDKRLKSIRDGRPLERKRLIKEGRMNPDGQMSLRDAVRLVGICTDMCPEYERVRRIVQFDVKAPECTVETQHRKRNDRVPDESRMVKAYARSAAGMDVELVTDLRSPATLLKTTEYLLDRLDNDEFEFLYTWVWDRLRAVRKDFRTQDVRKPHDIALYLRCLEYSSRFLLLSLHVMAGSLLKDYSSQQDMEQWNQTWISLNERYQDNRRAGLPSPNEAEFWAYRIILQPHYNQNNLESELHYLPDHVRLNPRIKVAIDIFNAMHSIVTNKPRYFSQAQANWRRFWVLINSPHVSYMMACAAETSFDKVRHTVLDTVWRVYRRGTISKPIVTEDWTIPNLKEVLGFDLDNEVVRFCESYGFKFTVNMDGLVYLDTISVPTSMPNLPTPENKKPNEFSDNIVEAKRYDRTFSAMIQGMSVRSAKASGLIFLREGQELTENVQQDEENNEIDSLFVQTASAGAGEEAKATTAPGTTSQLNPFALPGTSKPSPFSTPGATSNPSPFAAPGPTSNPSPFAAPKATSKLDPFASPFQPKLGSSPGSISGQVNPLGSSILGHKATTDTPKSAFESPFHAAASKLSSGPSAGNAQSGLFDPSKNPIKFAASTTNSPSSSVGGKNPFAPTTSTGPASSPFASVASSSTPATAGFPSGLSAAINDQPKDAPKVTASPAPDATVLEEQQRIKAEEDQQKALEEQKRAAEEQKRRAQEEARLARETEQRRLHEEQLKEKAREEARKAREEQERRALEEEQRRLAQIEAARKAREQEKEAGLDSVATQLFTHLEDGLLAHFVDHMVQNVFKETNLQLEEQKNLELADEYCRQRKQAWIRGMFIKWVFIVQKKKKARKAKERRKWLKENAEMLRNVGNETVQEPFNPSKPPKGVQQPNSTSRTSFKKPVIPESSQKKSASSNVRKRTRASQDVQPTEQPSAAKKPKTSTQATRVAKSNEETSHTNYSFRYHKSNKAPADRTETDWFDLRARGIDPSEYRKRSFDSFSDNDDDDEKQVVEPKRARTSPSASFRRSQPPPSTDEECLARFRAVRDAFNSSRSTPVTVNRTHSVNGTRSVNGTYSVNGTQSFNGAKSVSGKTSKLISQARELLANTPKQSPQVAHHGYSRSVPNFNMSTSSGHRSSFGQSIGTPQSNARPAYWARTSRFVPAHLYGKGPEAIMAYRKQYMNNSPPTAEPLQLSSPVPTQHPYVPQNHKEEYTEEEDSDDERQHVAGYAHEYVQEDSVMTDYEDEEYDEEEEENLDDYAAGHQYKQQYYEDEEQYSEEDDEIDESEEDSEQQFGQPRQQHGQSGFTQDDAIELSD